MYRTSRPILIQSKGKVSELQSRLIINEFNFHVFKIKVSKFKLKNSISKSEIRYMKKF